MRFGGLTTTVSFFTVPSTPRRTLNVVLTAHDFVSLTDLRCSTFLPLRSSTVTDPRHAFARREALTFKLRLNGSFSGEFTIGAIGAATGGRCGTATGTIGPGVGIGCGPVVPGA